MSERSKQQELATKDDIPDFVRKDIFWWNTNK